MLEAVSVSLGLVWAAAIPLVWQQRRRDGRLGAHVVAALLVAIAAAALGGAVAPLLYPEHLDLDHAWMIGSAWRAAMLTCGLYAIAVSRER